MATLTGHSGVVNAVAWSPGQQALSVAYSKTGALAVGTDRAVIVYHP